MKIGRRAFLFGAILVGVGVAPLGRRYFRSLENRGERLVRALCDQFVPGHDDVPGAVALGIDHAVVAGFHEKRRTRLRLLLLTLDLSASGFLALSVEDQRAFLRDELAAAANGRAPRRAATIDEVYRECTRLYLTNPDTWAAIRYRTPQPHGYPDYAESVAG